MWCWKKFLLLIRNFLSHFRIRRVQYRGSAGVEQVQPECKQYSDEYKAYSCALCFVLARPSNASALARLTNPAPPRDGRLRRTATLTRVRMSRAPSRASRLAAIAAISSDCVSPRRAPSSPAAPARSDHAGTAAFLSAFYYSTQKNPLCCLVAPFLACRA